MTGLTPEQRFANHKAGTKAARVVRRFGVRSVPKLYAHLNPMTYIDALAMEEGACRGIAKERISGVRQAPDEKVPARRVTSQGKMPTAPAGRPFCTGSAAPTPHELRVLIPHGPFYGPARCDVPHFKPAASY
jgi:hypothetical protein